MDFLAHTLPPPTHEAKIDYLLHRLGRRLLLVRADPLLVGRMKRLQVVALDDRWRFLNVYTISTAKSAGTRLTITTPAPDAIVSRARPCHPRRKTARK